MARFTSLCIERRHKRVPPLHTSCYFIACYLSCFFLLLAGSMGNCSVRSSFNRVFARLIFFFLFGNVSVCWSLDGNTASNPAANGHRSSRFLAYLPSNITYLLLYNNIAVLQNVFINEKIC